MFMPVTWAGGRGPSLKTRLSQGRERAAFAIPQRSGRMPKALVSDWTLATFFIGNWGLVKLKSWAARPRLNLVLSEAEKALLCHQTNAGDRFPARGLCVPVLAHGF